MKKLLLPFLFAHLFSITMNGQSMLTNRDVYDFNINDEFQFRAFNTPAMHPNVQRYKITGKRFSANNDTVFYKRYVTGYGSSGNYPVITYTFYAQNDSVSYSGLSDTLKNSYVKPDSCNWTQDTLYYSSSFCSTLVYENYSCSACCFEGQTHDYIYGKGLGQIKYEYTYAAYNQDYGNNLIYYKKDTLVCGTPDTITMQSTGISQISEHNASVTVYPNPTSDQFYIDANPETSSGQATTDKLNVDLYDVNGRHVFSANVIDKSNINVASLDEGIYTLTIKTVDRVINRKLVIVR